VHQYQPLHGGPYLTKEEFSLNLYEAIKTVGGMHGLERQRTAAIHAGHGHQVQDLVTRRAALVKSWAHHRAILTHDELQQILTRYPWARDL
jgi:hypothetical protein